MNPILQKILNATGLVRRGELVEATAAIQRALAGAVAPAASRDTRAEAPTSPAAEDPDTLDGLVREIDVIRADDVEPAAVAPAAAPRAAVVPGRSDAVLDTDDDLIEVPPLADRPRTGRFAESSFTAEAGTRGFKLFEPAGFEGRALPLVVMLHGCTQDPDDFAAGTRMNALAQEHGLYVLYPAQAPRSNAHKCWNWFRPGDQRRGQGEPALLAGMTRHVMATHRIDADRVWVAGLSAGGAMAAILAREYPDLFAAAGVHSGLPPGAANDVMTAFSAMKSGGRAATTAAGGAPLIVFHGDADGTVHALNGSHLIDTVLGGDPAQATREISPADGAGRAFTRTVYAPVDADGAEPGRALGGAWRRPRLGGRRCRRQLYRQRRAGRFARDASLFRRASASARAAAA